MISIMNKPGEATKASRTAGRGSLRTRLAALVLGAGLMMVGSGGATARDVIVRARDAGTAMVLQNVTLQDLVANTHGICDGSFSLVMKNSAGASNAVNFLDAAAGCGLKVILFFPETADHSTGVVYPSRVAYWAGLVKNHPALWGYLTVKEPSWAGISAAEIRSLYSAFKAADPNHRVMALFGDIPHFGEAANPYTSGMADVVMVDWYPVETGNGGSSTTGTTYISTGPTWFTKVRNAVDARTPGRPIWLMAQTHKYLAPATHKKQRPSETLLRRQVREGLAYLRARGIAFHTWSNTSYNSDQLRDPTMVSWMKRISSEIRTGTFN
jgi:hypothetical protein